MRALLTLTALLAVTDASSAGIEFFHGSFAEALQAARQQDRLLFVDVYTQWCGPCKMMDRDVFVLDEVGALYNASFINFKLDAEDASASGPELKARYGVEVFPTYLFIDGTGELRFKATSRMSAEVFLALAQRAMDGGPADFQHLADQVQAGSDDPLKMQPTSRPIVREYLLQAQVRLSTLSGEARTQLQRQVQAVRDRYFRQFEPGALLDPRDIALIQTFYFTRGDNPIELLVSGYERYPASVRTVELAGYLVRANDNAIRIGASRGDLSYRKYLEDIRTAMAPVYRDYSGPHADSRAAEAALEKIYRGRQLTAAFHLAVSRSDWATAISAMNDFLALRGTEATWEDWFQLPRSFYRCEDIDYLRQAVPFARRAYKLQPDFKTASTLGRLLARSGETGPAREMLSTAVKLGRDEALKNKDAQLRELTALIEGL